MRIAFPTLVLLIFGCLSADYSLAQAPQGNRAGNKARIERVRGMKDAVADIEKGILTQRLAFPFAPPRWIVDYIDLAKKEFGIDIGLIRDGTREDDGYNDVMLMEIEHRFGRGALNKLAVRVEAEYPKNKKK